MPQPTRLVLCCGGPLDGQWKASPDLVIRAYDPGPPTAPLNSLRLNEPLPPPVLGVDWAYQIEPIEFAMRSYGSMSGTFTVWVGIPRGQLSPTECDRALVRNLFQRDVALAMGAMR